MIRDEDRISASFLISIGFSSPFRWFDDRWKQFRVSYEIEGYDCHILISPSPQFIGGISPEGQIDEHTDIEFLEQNHYNDWQIYINNRDNHLVTLNTKEELINLLDACKVGSE